MPNESAITRLLYAMLSQKCLKDIDWNKVARDPILSQEITNGHAARMRYSRFKKQMEGAQPATTTTTRKPRNKNRVEKNKSASSSSSKKSKHAKHFKNEEDQDDDEEYLGHHGQRIKSEHGYERHYHNNHTRIERHFPTPELDSGPIMLSTNSTSNARVKTESGPGLSISNLPMTPLPSTPHTTASFSTTPNYTRFLHDASASPSPGTSFGAHGSLDDGMDEMMASFGMPGASASGQDYFRSGEEELLGLIGVWDGHGDADADADAYGAWRPV